MRHQLKNIYNDFASLDDLLMTIILTVSIKEKCIFIAAADGIQIVMFELLMNSHFKNLDYVGETLVIC